MRLWSTILLAPVKGDDIGKDNGDLAELEPLLFLASFQASFSCRGAMVGVDGPPQSQLPRSWGFFCGSVWVVGMNAQRR